MRRESIAGFHGDSNQKGASFYTSNFKVLTLQKKVSIMVLSIGIGRFEFFIFDSIFDI